MMLPEKAFPGASLGEQLPCDHSRGIRSQPCDQASRLLKLVQEAVERTVDAEDAPTPTGFSDCVSELTTFGNGGLNDQC